MKKFNVLVTGIGGNVGQGIIRNLRNINNLFINVIGCNVIEISAGNHLCDVVYKTPYAYDNDYIPTILSICEKENIQLILPSTDYEVYYLSLHREKLPQMPISPSETNIIFLDKYKTWKFFSENAIPFAESFLPSNYKNQFNEFIVKPREGRGSRGIHINPQNLDNFSDEYIIQKLIKGKEITTAFYVTKSKKLHGFITFERELQSGATAFCEVTHQYDDKMLPMIEKMMKSMLIVGSCNIQAIVDGKSGSIIPFEINGRISGTNSIRSQFGFKDIQYMVEEYLLDIQPQDVIISEGCAIRILMDVIYPNKNLKDIKNRNSDHYLF
jgi:carbamoyl-phosphate synthase large subunit